MITAIACKGKEDIAEALSQNKSRDLNMLAAWNPSSFPLTVKISSELNGQEASSATSSFEQWDNAVIAVNVFSDNFPSIQDPKHRNLEAYRDSHFGIYQVNDTDPLTDPSLDQAKALAITQFYAIKSKYQELDYYRIIEADIFINKRYYSFSTTTDNQKYDLPSVIIHEAGHLLGLGHQQFDAESVMTPSISRALEKRSLFPQDQNDIYNLYVQLLDSLSPPATPMALRASEAPINEDEVVRVITHLLPDGHCEHYENGKLKLRHKAH